MAKVLGIGVASTWLYQNQSADPARLLQSDDEADWQQAFDQFDSLTAANPNNSQAWLGRAQAQLQILTGRPDLLRHALPEVTATIERAIELEPENESAHLMLARVQFLVGWDMNAAETMVNA